MRKSVRGRIARMVKRVRIEARDSLIYTQGRMVSAVKRAMFGASLRGPRATDDEVIEEVNR